MNPRLQALLEHLASTLTIQRESQIEALHRRALNWKPVERLPLVFSYPSPPGLLAPYPHSETLDDPEKMLFNECISAWGTSIAHRDHVGDDLPCTVRANFGTGIIASLFGARLEQVDENPPWVRPFESLEAFEAALDRDPLDFTRGWGPRVIERYCFFRDVLADYPPLASIIKRVLPDLQGPLDTVELLRGSDLFLDVSTRPELVTRALDIAATAQIGFARHLAPYLSPSSDGWSHQHGFLIPGNILVRVDSAVMLAPSMYRRQVQPHDQRVLCELGGGGLHSCGRITHLAPEFFSLPSMQCLDLGQPELNDLDDLYSQARHNCRPLIRVKVPESDLTSGAVLRRFPTGVSLFHEARSVDHARDLMRLYLEQTGQKVD